MSFFHDNVLVELRQGRKKGNKFSPFLFYFTFTVRFKVTFCPTFRASASRARDGTTRRSSRTFAPPWRSSCSRTRRWWRSSGSWRSSCTWATSGSRRGSSTTWTRRRLPTGRRCPGWPGSSASRTGPSSTPSRPRRSSRRARLWYVLFFWSFEEFVVDLEE